MAKMSGPQRMVLQAILDLPKDSAGFVTDSQIVQKTQSDLMDVRNCLQSLDGRYIEIAPTQAGLSAWITPEGRLALGQDRSSTSPTPGPDPPPRSLNVRYNLVVVGKTGVGKTELVNYLFEKDVQKTGIGRPITPIGFHRQDLTIVGIPASIWDSAGLEVGDHEAWMRALREELSQRGLTQPIEKWFHTVLYCVQAPGARIEPFEIQLINQFLEERYNVIVVITKSYISKCKCEELVAAIKEQPLSRPLSYVMINSKDEEIVETLPVVKRFGRDQLMKEIRLALIESLTERVPLRCIRLMEEYVDKKCKDLIDSLIHMVGSKKKNDISNYIETTMEGLLDDVTSPKGRLHVIICHEMKQTVSKYGEIASIMEQAIALTEDTSIVGKVSCKVWVPKVKGYWKETASVFDYYINESNILDNLFGYGKIKNEVVRDICNKIAYPLYAICAAEAGGIFTIHDHLEYKENMSRQIGSFNEDLKQKIRMSEDKIRSFFSERLKQI